MPALGKFSENHHFGAEHKPIAGQSAAARKVARLGTTD